MAVVLRAPTAEDSDRLGFVHVRAWQAAYRGAMPTVYLDALEPSARADMWARRIAEPAPGVDVVAELDGVVVGFVCTGPGHEDPKIGELYAINVDPDAWGTGIGPALLARASDDLRSAGFAEAVLWVVTANERARRFYERVGWSSDGAGRDLELGGAAVSEVRYRCPL